MQMSPPQSLLKGIGEYSDMFVFLSHIIAWNPQKVTPTPKFLAVKSFIVCGFINSEMIDLHHQITEMLLFFWKI